jgi:hypothetical protein
VENDYNVQKLKDLIRKNFERYDEEDIKTLEKKISFSFNYMTKEKRKNWVVKIPERF